jgi:hypothetical protein
MPGRSIIRKSSLLIGECWLNEFLPFCRIPGPELGMGFAVLLGYGMCANDHFEAVLFLYEIAEVGDVRTGRVAYEHPCRKMNDLCAILLHLFRGVFNISAGATVTSGKSDEFDVVVLVNAECSFFALQRTKTLPPSARSISITNNDANFDLFVHDLLLSPSRDNDIDMFFCAVPCPLRLVQQLL